MRISCQWLADFLTNLEGQSIYQKTIYVERLTTILNGRTKQDASSFEVGLRVSAVLEYPDGGQALLEAAEVCGIDRLTEHSMEGTQRQEALLRQLYQECGKFGLQVRPGTLDL